jgi:Protein of unknown function (DUF3106)
MPFSVLVRRIAQPAFAGLLLLATALVMAQPVSARNVGGASHPQWMDRHSNLPLAEQQRALEREPGFRDLPSQTQQRMLDRLTQLNGMSPEQRRRIIEHTEAMERLTLPQRQQVRGALQQLGGLPEDRRRLIARAFRDLREMPPPQRQATFNSERFRGQFSDQERDTLSNLLAVEPYIPF